MKYLDLGKILSGGWDDNVFDKNQLIIRIFLLNPNNMYDDSYLYFLFA